MGIIRIRINMKGQRDMEIKDVENNDVEVPNECGCLWCGGIMRRDGAAYVGCGVNSFTMWCKNCGAITIHAKHHNRKIAGYSIKYEYEK